MDDEVQVLGQVFCAVATVDLHKQVPSEGLLVVPIHVNDSADGNIFRRIAYFGLWRFSTAASGTKILQRDKRKDCVADLKANAWRDERRSIEVLFVAEQCLV